MINVFQPSLGAHELEAVARVFDSNWIGKGPKVKEFEEAWAEHLNVPSENVVSTTSATEALFQVCQLIRFYRTDEVIMPAISFVGAANAVLAAGARPVFCDVDERTLNPSLSDIRALYTKETAAVILLHYGGVPPADLVDIACWCDEHGIILIEDCAISPASRLDGVACGVFGDYGIWSFDPMKILSAGSGGMIYCREPVDVETLRGQMNLGMTSASGFSSGQDSRWWEFNVNVPGRLATMNDITAAIALEQLGFLPFYVARRRAIHHLYDHLLGDSVVKPPPIEESEYGLESSYYAYWIQHPDRDGLAAHLKRSGVYTTFRYYPLHRIPLYGVQRILPNSERAAANTLLLPLHQSLSNADVETVASLVAGYEL